MDKHHTGLCSEYMVMAHLAGRGADIFHTSGIGRADFLYVTGAGTVKAQVKTSTRIQSGTYIYEQARLVKRFDSVTSNADRFIAPFYTEEEVDEIWVVGTHIWCFPITTVLGLTSLALLSNGPRPRQKLYNPEAHIIIRGTWKNPLRKILNKQ